MRDYKRMTQKTDKGYVVAPYIECAGDLKTVVDCLGEIEDKIENGTMVELPCLRDLPVVSNVYGRVKELNYILSNGHIHTEIFFECEFEQAEARLRELQEQKK